MYPKTWFQESVEVLIIFFCCRDTLTYTPKWVRNDSLDHEIDQFHYYMYYCKTYHFLGIHDSKQNMYLFSEGGKGC